MNYYTIRIVTAAQLVANGWTEDAAWGALGRRKRAVVVSNPGFDAIETVYQCGLMAGQSSARFNDDAVAGAAGIYADEAAAQAAIAVEAASIEQDRADEAADEATWEALPETEKAARAEAFRVEVAVSRIKPITNFRATKTMKAAVHAAAAARGESVAEWLRIAVATAPAALPPVADTGEPLDQIINLRLSVAARREFGAAAHKAGLEPSEYLRRCVAARLERRA